MIRELEKYAKENYVPISRPDTVNYLKETIVKNKYKKILEIGTAIGYTSILLALIDKKINIVTIERNGQMYQEAIKNIKKFNLADQIKVIFDDALNVNLDGDFDLIYIDAAKSQNIKFIEKFSPLLNKNGIIIVDNMLLLDVIKNAKPKKAQQLIKKTEVFKEYLANNTEFIVEYKDDIGDGFALIKKIDKIKGL